MLHGLRQAIWNTVYISVVRKVPQHGQNTLMQDLTGWKILKPGNALICMEALIYTFRTTIYTTSGNLE